MSRILIDAEELQQKLQNEELLLIDVRSKEQYQQGHLTKAVHFNLSQLNASSHGEPFPTVGLLPTNEVFNAAMLKAGIRDDQTIVVYDDGSGPPAARFAWTLKAFGHPSILMLNGGFAQWQALDYPTSQSIPAETKGNFKGERQQERIADQTHITKNLQNGDTLIIDTRSADEFSGVDLRASRGGHIPGAINLNWVETKNTENPALFKSTSELSQLFNQLGINPEKEIICYCQSHQRSSVLCILLEDLGYPNVKGYPGAWSDWGNQADTPIDV